MFLVITFVTCKEREKATWEILFATDENDNRKNSFPAQNSKAPKAETNIRCLVKTGRFKLPRDYDGTEARRNKRKFYAFMTFSEEARWQHTWSANKLNQPRNFERLSGFLYRENCALILVVLRRQLPSHPNFYALFMYRISISAFALIFVELDRYTLHKRETILWRNPTLRSHKMSSLMMNILRMALPAQFMNNFALVRR